MGEGVESRYELAVPPHGGSKNRMVKELFHGGEADMFRLGPGFKDKVGSLHDVLRLDLGGGWQLIQEGRDLTLEGH
jgi:hypothetical protein